MCVLQTMSYCEMHNALYIPVFFLVSFFCGGYFTRNVMCPHEGDSCQSQSCPFKKAFQTQDQLGCLADRNTCQYFWFRAALWMNSQAACRFLKYGISCPLVNHKSRTVAFAWHPPPRHRSAMSFQFISPKRDGYEARLRASIMIDQCFSFLILLWSIHWLPFER